MIDEILSNDDINWVIRPNLSRRFLYHAASIHNKNIRENNREEEQIDGINILTDKSIFYFLKLGNPTDAIDYGLYDSGESSYLPFDLPFFDLVKKDYTIGERIALTPVMQKMTGFNYLASDCSPTLSTTVSFVDEQKCRTLAFADKFDCYESVQDFLTRSFEFYESLWWSINNGKNLAQRCNESEIQLVRTPDLDYI